MKNNRFEKIHSNTAPKLLGSLLLERHFEDVDGTFAETDLHGLVSTSTELTLALARAVGKVELSLKPGIRLQVTEVEHIKTHHIGGAIYLTNAGATISNEEYDQLAIDLKTLFSGYLRQAIHERSTPQMILEFELEREKSPDAGKEFSANFYNAFSRAADVFSLDPERGDIVQQNHFPKMAKQDPKSEDLGKVVLVGKVLNINTHKHAITFKPAGDSGVVEVGTTRPSEVVQLFLIFQFDLECEISCRQTKFAAQNRDRSKIVLTLENIISRESRSEDDDKQQFENLRAAFSQISTSLNTQSEQPSLSFSNASEESTSVKHASNDLKSEQPAKSSLHRANRTPVRLSKNNTKAPALVAAQARRNRKKRQPI